jgi:hypothetical protein
MPVIMAQRLPSAMISTLQPPFNQSRIIKRQGGPTSKNIVAMPWYRMPEVYVEQ